jgi:hypothetical protein
MQKMPMMIQPIMMQKEKAENHQPIRYFDVTNRSAQRRAIISHPA